MKIAHLFRIAIVVSAFAFMCFGCRKSKLNSDVSQRYQVNFIKSDGRAIVMAWFVDNNGSRVWYSNRTIVTANDQVDTALNTNDPSYFSWTLDSTNEVEFKFRKDGNMLINKIAISAIDDITLVIDSVLSANDTMRLSYAGREMPAGESIGMSMNGNVLVDSNEVWHGISGEFIGRECVLDFSKTKDFHPGTYTVSIARTKTLPIQNADGTAGGQIKVTLTDIRTVVVK